MNTSKVRVDLGCLSLPEPVMPIVVSVAKTGVEQEISVDRGRNKRYRKVCAKGVRITTPAFDSG